jgi:glycerate kinase
MKIVIAPNAFKGTLTAKAVANAISVGILRSLPDADTIIAPVADGGDGALETLLDRFSGIRRSALVSGPLGEPVEAYWGIINEGRTTLIEAALAFGIALVPSPKRNPAITTSRGVGELILSGLDLGIRDFMLAVGGSANNDGGTGMMRALGMRFLDDSGAELDEGGLALARLDRIDDSGTDQRLLNSTFQVLCDSSVPLTGPIGVSIMYSPGKGASQEVATALDESLKWYAHVVRRQYGSDMERMTGAGSGGGVVGAAEVFLSADVSLGIDYILDAIDFDDHLQDADLVVTGEGRVDEQTIYNKAPFGVAKRAKQFHLPVIAISATVGDGWEGVLDDAIDAVVRVAPDDHTTVNERMIAVSTAEAFASALVAGVLGSPVGLKSWGERYQFYGT